MPHSYKYTPIANKTELAAQYIGKQVQDLPTPALIINRPKFKANCQHMAENASSLDAKFRAHVKTHKTLEGAELQVDGTTNRIVVSTMVEAWNIGQCNKIKDIHFSLPVVASSIGQYADFAGQYDGRFSIMVDNIDQIDALVKYRKSKDSRIKRWSVLVKVDQGYHRAGLQVSDQAMDDLIARILDDETREHVELFGFYCHAGNSYSVDSETSAKSLLIEEIQNVNEAAAIAQKIQPGSPLVLSVGATPTAHASELLTLEELSRDLGGIKLRGELELHAGNYPCCDLQQVATGCVDPINISLSVLAEVVSTYPERGDVEPGEQLINAGVLALARETSQIPGFGKVVKPEGHGDWIVGKLSQEHGILRPTREGCEFFPYGAKLRIVPQHACIAAACFPYYFVVGEDDETIEDVWVSFRGW
ncbi:D-serine dehydratase [Candida viswanathii]|uniref:D-serine dehydratase n=1 Tax=Candida viswanathii TaxID=5486 RepID=A0A367YHW4_9ASCO|nr:D-serine dehydratase [Candida viswanathii]